MSYEKLKFHSQYTGKSTADIDKKSSSPLKYTRRVVLVCDMEATVVSVGIDDVIHNPNPLGILRWTSTIPLLQGTINRGASKS